MVALKCKMCGGNLIYNEGQSYGICDSCGSMMTLPQARDERILNLFNRANQYRLQNEFDKALATYESILGMDNKNAEAHWGCVISRFGVEYVEDPKTHTRIPTLHRVQKEPVLSDLDYKSALQYADPDARALYQKEAIDIFKLQKDILTVANGEAPYDVFICYKEADEHGERTIDSVLAQEVYFQLQSNGYKTFFARISLEDKLGQEYEPYIFAALNSAKVMLVIGTKPEYFNAIWVKNEWARFLALARQDRQKVLIPCFRDMDAYDLPEELSLYQSQDMSKIGFAQDLLYGIQKIFSKHHQSFSTTANPTSDYTSKKSVLLKRAFLLLEEANWSKANELLENVLNIDPENAEAYVGKLMIELKVNRIENLANRAAELDRSANYGKAIRFADESLRKKLESYCVSAKQKLATMLEKEKERELQAALQSLENEYNQNAKWVRIIRLGSICFSIFSLVFGIGTFIDCLMDPYPVIAPWVALVVFPIVLSLPGFIGYYYCKRKTDRIRLQLRKYGIRVQK